MPDFIEPQLAKLVAEPPKGSDWVHEIKFDGYRMQARIAKGRVAIRSRNGREWSDRFPEIAIGLESFPDCILDGEICALTQSGMPTFAGLQGALSDKRTSLLVFFLFDCLWLKGDDKRPYALGTRKSILKRLIEEHESPRLRYVEHMETDGAAMFKSACQLKLEGIVSKRVEKNAPGLLRRLRTMETAKMMFEANQRAARAISTTADPSWSARWRSKTGPIAGSSGRRPSRDSARTKSPRKS